MKKHILPFGLFSFIEGINPHLSFFSNLNAFLFQITHSFRDFIPESEEKILPILFSVSKSRKFPSKAKPTFSSCLTSLNSL